ncbi:hypothetical protein LIER_31561 [Lithospermum erythrorhizon]|uniref:Uncharacterized protein n=1 Tax=Lithospermum erythrorhizon TaxID=34254 RepID=A0AAV3RRF8_LITER
MRLDDLIGNLTTFEMKFDSTKSANKKGVALMASCKEGNEEDLNETMNLPTKSFKKIMKRFNKRPYTTGDNSSGSVSNVKKQTKTYYATHSDEDSDKDEGSDSVNNFVAFTAQVFEKWFVNPSVSHIQYGNISDDEEDLTEEELIANYQLLFTKGLELTQVYTVVEAEMK